MKKESFNYDNIKINEEELSITKIGEIVDEEQSNTFVLVLFGLILVFIFLLPVIVKLFEAMDGLFDLYFTIFRFYGRFTLFAGIDVITKLYHLVSMFLLGILSGFQANGIMGIASSLFRYGCSLLGAVLISVLFSFLFKLKK